MTIFRVCYCERRNVTKAIRVEATTTRAAIINARRWLSQRPETLDAPIVLAEKVSDSSHSRVQLHRYSR